MFLAPLAAAITPTAATVVSVGAAVAGTALTAYSQNQSAKMQAQIAANNAKIAEQNAQDAITQAAIEAQMDDQQAQAFIGELLAEQSASGLSLGSGSYALRRKSASELAARDRSITYDAGQRRAKNFRQQSSDFASEAALARAQGRNSLLAGGIEIGSSLISGAATLNQQKAKGLIG